MPEAPDPLTSLKLINTAGLKPTACHYSICPLSPLQSLLPTLFNASDTDFRDQRLTNRPFMFLLSFPIVYSVGQFINIPLEGIIAKPAI